MVDLFMAGHYLERINLTRESANGANGNYILTHRCDWLTHTAQII